MAESLCEELGKEILNLSEDIAKKKIDKAQYDKSYNAVILGINQNFVDDVPEKEKTELISKHSIPETTDNGKYYTFKINGVYYVKKSNTDFKLYEDVVIRVPNGNWNDMFIEVQRDTVNDSGESPIGDFGQVSFDKNRLYYNGETYHLQFGWNKRIMCVTKGDKHAIINSPDYTGSRIEAATAVMKGLTEDWDIVFDNYCCETAEGYTLNLSSILTNYSGAVKCDWGDGTVNNELSHTYYNTACVVVKIKLLGEIPSETKINAMNIMWSTTQNVRFWVHNIGARLYIGGLIKGAYITSHGNAVTHICYGENIKAIKGSLSYPQVAERQFEVGIPPFVESISGSPYMYNGASYLYIPESCVSISGMAFAYNGASEIEIEEKGETLTIGENAFGYTASKEIYNRLDVLRIPARVVQENGRSILEDCYVRAVIYGRGRTEIPSQLCYGAEKGSYLSEIEDKPYFIFIPRTVTSIGDFLLYPYSPKRQVYIICEGIWDNIAKSSNWDGASGSRGNIEIYSESCLYNSAENIINTFIRKG